MKLKYPPVRYRVHIERSGSRRIIEKLMESNNLTLLELAPQIYGKNMRAQVKRMLYQSGYSVQQIDEIMSKRQIEKEKNKIL